MVIWEIFYSHKTLHPYIKRLLRIIGGQLKGKKLLSNPGLHIRPTKDRVRESIFNILGWQINNVMVLDLFAGTGALGIEALSRGARSAIFIDNHKKSIVILKKNINSCSLHQKAKIIKWNIEKNLFCIRDFKPLFNLVFIDAPYGRKLIPTALFNLYKSNSLEKGALTIVEHGINDIISQSDLPFVIKDQRRYGKTLVSFLNYVI